MLRASRASSDMRLLSQGGSKVMRDRAPCDARDRGDGILDPDRHLAGHRAARRRQRHVDRDVAVVVDVDLVDQAQLVDVGRGFPDRRRSSARRRCRRVSCSSSSATASSRRPACRLRRPTAGAAAARQAAARPAASAAAMSLSIGLPSPWSCLMRKSRARLISASTSASTSACVLYMANDARHVAVTPRRSISGCAQWWPARTATPERSMMVEMSCGCRPSIVNETIAPLPGAVP